MGLIASFINKLKTIINIFSNSKPIFMDQTKSIVPQPTATTLTIVPSVPIDIPSASSIKLGKNIGSSSEIRIPQKYYKTNLFNI
jgi:hypothetical protein